MDMNYVFEIEKSEEQRSKKRIVAYAERIRGIQAAVEKAGKESNLK